ncbi:hypothetical protein BKA65DRAFT_480378 [Rhexocercosporidium sp. MPI-PUGE-AT-0058]|nr:hypothetical protein BKA65DRAFT_480378 [Rhexocercosporidium sp. MPI-PUGE-AT-0058]
MPDIQRQKLTALVEMMPHAKTSRTASEYADKDALRSFDYQQDNPDEGKREYRQMTPLNLELRQQLSAVKEMPHAKLFFREVQQSLRLAVIIHATLSLYLILYPVVAFWSAQKTAGHPLDSIPGTRTVTTRSCTVFVALIGTYLVSNLVLVVIFCCLSKKALKSRKPCYALLLGIGVSFAIALSACLVLKNGAAFPNDLWSWSCDNQKSQILSDALDFAQTCHSISTAWKYSIVLVSFEAMSLMYELVGFMIPKF